MSTTTTKPLANETAEQESRAYRLLEQKLREKPLPDAQGTLRTILASVDSQIRQIEALLTSPTSDGGLVIPDASRECANQLTALFENERREQKTVIRDGALNGKADENPGATIQQLSEMIGRWRTVESPLVAIHAMLKKRRDYIERLLRRSDVAYERYLQAGDDLHSKTRGEAPRNEEEKALEKTSKAALQEQQNLLDKRRGLNQIPLEASGENHGNGDVNHAPTLDQEIERLRAALLELAKPISVQPTQLAFADLYRECLAACPLPQKKEEVKPLASESLLNAVNDFGNVIIQLYWKARDSAKMQEGGDNLGSEAEMNKWSKSVCMHLLKSKTEKEYLTALQVASKACVDALPKDFTQKVLSLGNAIAILDERRIALRKNAERLKKIYTEERSRILEEGKKRKKTMPMAHSEMMMGSKQQQKLTNKVREINSEYAKAYAIDEQITVLRSARFTTIALSPFRSTMYGLKKLLGRLPKEDDPNTKLS